MFDRSNYSGSEAYKDAAEAHHNALKAYDVARTAYHAKKIGDAEFLAARDAKVAADRAFDAAYAAERGNVGSVDPDEQCSVHDCARHRCDEEHASANDDREGSYRVAP